MKWLFDKLINGESFTLDYFINMEGDNFPLLYDLSATNQDTIWHEEGNVYIHTSMVLAEAFKLIENNEIKLSLNEKAVLVLSAVFHDIGKTSTTKTIDIEGKDRVISPRHPQVGASYLQYRLDLGNKELEKEVIDVVMHHHDVKECILGNSFESEILYITRNVAGKLLYLLEVADIKGRICPEKDMLLFDLEIFKEYAERTNCFYEKGDLDKRLIEYFKESGINVDINSHSFIKTKYDLLNGIIDEPHTGLTKHYQNINPSIGYVLVGLSGSGKTTTASKIAKAEHVETIISTDSMRKGNRMP
jgi:putative nucleotidyltransferase with HDIG domain